MDQLDKIPGLIAGHLRKNLTTTEQQELTAWINESEANRKFFDEVTDDEHLAEKIREFMQYDTEAALSKVMKDSGTRHEQQRNKMVIRFKRLAIAACLLVIAGASVYYFLWDGGKAKQNGLITSANSDKLNDVQPGTEKAILTLSDGSQIVLDSTSNGNIAKQGNTIVVKENGILAYNEESTGGESEMLYNSLTTPKGGEYRSLILSDGTKVWLNAVSSVRYPISFTGKERRVEITGEAYFEVAANKSMPFRVVANDVEVEVLGTHFNVNAYSDEDGIKTTLLEGAVRVMAGGKTSVLKPGQQAKVAGNKDVTVTTDVNIGETMAWKNGVFVYDGADIKTIMRQVSRWYDVEVTYEDDIPLHFVVTGISRSMPVSKLFSVLEKTGGVKFEINGKSIIVKSK